MAEPVQTASSPPDKTWRASGGRRVTLSFIFMILLPFYVSIGPMLYQRVSRGLWLDAVTLAVFGLAFSLLMLLVLAQLIHSIRSRVDLGPSSVKVVLPALKRGPIPLFRFNNPEIPYADIAGVDTRTEVYGGSLAPVLLKSTRLTLTNGDRLVLGYTDSNDTDDIFPYPQIGAEIAALSGKTVVDHGVVKRSIQKRVLGVSSAADENQPLTTGEMAAINTSHRRNVLGVVIGLVLLVAVGITIDFATASRTSFVDLAGSASTPAPVPAKKK
jgi:hypothetical protein